LKWSLTNLPTFPELSGSATLLLRRDKTRRDKTRKDKTRKDKTRNGKIINSSLVSLDKGKAIVQRSRRPHEWGRGLFLFFFCLYLSSFPLNWLIVCIFWYLFFRLIFSSIVAHILLIWKIIFVWLFHFQLRPRYLFL